jgi:hypothetical protein
MAYLVKKKALQGRAFVDLTELFSNRFVEGLEIICLANIQG